MSDKTYEMIGDDGEQYGPFTIQQLQDTLSQGRANAQTQIRETGAGAWQLLGQVLNPGTPVAASPPLGAVVPSDQPLDVGMAFSSGWGLFKQHMGLMIGAGVIYLVILIVAGIIGAVIPFAQLLVQGPLTGGFIILILNLSRYGQAEIGDLFLGFKNYGWLLLVSIIQVAIVFAALIPGLIVMLVGGLIPLMGEGSAEIGGASITLLIIGFLLMMILAIVASVLTYFAMFLVADNRAEFGDAFVVGFRASKKNFWGVIGLFVLIGIVATVSAIPCGLGLIFTLPWSFAVMAQAYEQMFSPSSAALESEE